MSALPAQAERRAVGRESTVRRALFSSGTAWQPADVLDISPNGMQLRSAQAMAVGEALEVEIQPKRGPGRGEVVLVRGRVAWTRQQSAGRHLVGMHFESDATPGAGEAIRSGADARALLAELQGALRAASDAPPLAYAAYRRMEADLEEQEGKRRLWPLLVLLFLLLPTLAALLAISLPGESVLPEGSRTGLMATSADESAEVRKPNAHMEGVGGPELRVDGANLAELMARGWGSLALGDAHSAEILFGQLASLSEITDAARVGALLGLAEALRAAGDETGAKAALVRALPLVPAQNMPWRQALEGAAGRLDSPGTIAPVFMEDALGLEAAEEQPEPASPKGPDAPQSAPVPSRDQQANAGAEQTWVEVDTSDYALRVWRGEELVAAFPVGLGSDNSTPEGEFAIANKLENPDWYNKGDVVPANDPANPLGGRWMGLGSEGAATSYGIHGTTQPESIGENQSLGCIRMFPADAAEVFRLVEVGDLVRIHL